MSQPLQALLLAGELKDVLFSPTSRYYGIETASLEDASGVTTTYLRRRFVPPADSFATLEQHRVVEGDRLDNLAAHYLGDPELYWRICDANGALRPDELTEEPGRLLRITMPEGVPGVPEAAQ